jgi:hypothetical protein
VQTTIQATDTTAIPFTDLKLSELPHLGTDWPGQGGQFAGLVRGEKGMPDYLLILGPEYAGELSWQPANDWAAGLEIDGHKDFTLPTRPEQSLLFSTVGDQFQREWYWSNSQRAAFPVCAWLQLFGNGNQNVNHKSNLNRARAVRRIKI